MAPDLDQQLGITAEQRKKLDDIRFSSEKIRIQAQADLRIQQLDLERLMSADVPDRAAIDKKVQDIAQAQGALMRSRINSDLDRRSVLTKEQRDKMRDLRQQRREGPPPKAQPPTKPAGPKRNVEKKV